MHFGQQVCKQVINPRVTPLTYWCESGMMKSITNYIEVSMHYVCTGGCQGVSDQPGVCQAADCKKYHQDLTACNCTDGQHQEVMEHASKAASEADH